MAYGVLPEGFVIKPLSQIKADIIARCVASDKLGPGQDYGDTDPLGQIIGAVAGDIAEIWELGYAVHTSGDPEGALDVPLDQVLSLAGSERQGAEPTRVVGASLSLDAGTLVPAGSLVSVEDRPDIQFALAVDVENPGGSPADITVDVNGAPAEFVCTEDGPINVNADALNVIDSSVSGWNAVTNPTAAIPGREVAGNVEFRQRWADERARSGSTTVSAIRAALLDTQTTPEFSDIEKVLVLENKQDVVDVNGLPPHSVEAIVDDGAIPTVDDDLIAQVIWDRGAAGGIDTHGTQSGIAVDSEGVEHTIRFSRVTRREIWITLSIDRGNKYPLDGDTKVAQALVTAGNAYDVEDDVIALFIRLQAFSVAGVTDVPDFAIGLSAAPTLDANIPMGYRERATFSTDRVTVTEA